MLFTAIAGTVVILPWAVQGSPFGDDRRPLAEQTQLVQQPLTGIGGGETVREIHQDTPFSLVALTAADLSGTSARVRAKKADGSWGPWYEAETLDGVGDGSPAPRGTEPVFVGLTTTVQIAVTRPGGTTASAPQQQAETGAAKPDLGYIPANANQPFGQNINAVLISPPQAPMDNLPLPSAARRARPAAQHHHPRPMGCRRLDAVPEHRVRRRCARRRRAPHRGQQRLRAAGFGGDRPIDLRLSHPHAGLVRHRLQRVGRQVRSGFRGPGRRHDQTGRGRPHRRLQQEHLGCGDARQLRRRAADTDPIAHRRTAAGLATGHGPRRPEGHSRFDVGTAARSPTSRPAQPRPCPRSSPTATSATPTARATPRTP